MKLISDPFGVIEHRGKPVVSSRYVAKVFEREHFHVLRSIETLAASTSGLSDDFRQHNFVPSSYKDITGRKLSEYLLTRDGFTMVAMEFKTKKARQFKEAYIERFNQMEIFIKNLQYAKAEFPEFTEAIMLAHDEPKHYHFSNECDMINAIVLGMTAKKFREIHGIRAGNSIRPYLQHWQIEAIRTLQRMDIGLIMAVPDFQERKRMLIARFQRLRAKQLTAPGGLVYAGVC